MSEQRYRPSTLVLVTILGTASAIIGWLCTRIGGQLTLDGRYLQFDRQKDFSIMCSTSQGGQTEPSETDTCVLKGVKSH
jgi:hypothetical protein